MKYDEKECIFNCMVDDCYTFIRVTMIKEITVMRISMRFLLQECRTHW